MLELNIGKSLSGIIDDEELRKRVSKMYLDGKLKHCILKDFTTISKRLSCVNSGSQKLKICYSVDSLKPSKIELGCVKHLNYDTISICRHPESGGIMTARIGHKMVSVSKLIENECMTEEEFIHYIFGSSDKNIFNGIIVYMRDDFFYF